MKPFSFPIPCCGDAVEMTDLRTKFFIVIDLGSGCWQIVAEPMCICNNPLVLQHIQHEPCPTAHRQRHRCQPRGKDTHRRTEVKQECRAVVVPLNLCCVVSHTAPVIRCRISR